MNEFTIDGAMAKVAACKQQMAISGNFAAAGAIHLTEMVVELLKAEIARLVAPSAVEPSEAK